MDSVRELLLMPGQGSGKHCQVMLPGRAGRQTSLESSWRGVPWKGETPTAHFHIFGKCLARRAAQLRPETPVQVHANRAMFGAFTRHGVDVPVQVCVSFLRLALEREVFFNCVASSQEW
jgi:hypothetical protein